MFVEKLVDQFDDIGLRPHLLCGRFWARRGERLDFAAFEADVNLGSAFRRHLDEGGILDDVGEQSLAFAVWRIRICPEPVEVDRHRDQPLADSFIEDQLILLPSALAIVTGFGQHAKLVVPFAFERVGDEAIVAGDQHKAPLGKIGFDLGAFDRATAQPIRFFIPRFDLFPNLERQLDGSRRHLLANQHADGFVDRRTGD
ncbi:hypothetical protein [Bradyrhizobium sp. Ec3.3]|uniref:hypothetical protein n=1 Tax=Bradyrhizobium sp. Ec3.3 TaxID=189753 RepID=UPI001FD94532|nr:hypothetical protein [Bradyrhizobium sp. Ec3.3]